MKKRFLCYLVVCFLFISNVFASHIENVNINNKDIPKVNETEKIYDFAELLTEFEKEQIYNEIMEFISNSNLDMVLVTINDNPKNSAMRYAEDFYDYNNFGIGNTCDGLIFLIDMDTREMWISTTGNAQLIYDDYRINKILDATYNEITNKNYYECVSVFIDKASYYYNLGIPNSNKNAYVNENGDYIYNYSRNFEFDSIFFLVAFIITLIIVLIMKSRHKTIKKATTALPYMIEKNITYREDSFLSTNTSRVYDPPSTSRSSGGSSTHRGSSGTSHGGGGRRF